jgi:hypothetical protein
MDCGLWKGVLVQFSYCTYYVRVVGNSHELLCVVLKQMFQLDFYNGILLATRVLQYT